MLTYNNHAVYAATIGFLTGTSEPSSKILLTDPDILCDVTHIALYRAVHVHLQAFHDVAVWKEFRGPCFEPNAASSTNMNSLRPGNCCFICICFIKRHQKDIGQFLCKWMHAICFCFDNPHSSPNLYPGHIAICVRCIRQVDNHHTVLSPPGGHCFGTLGDHMFCFKCYNSSSSGNGYSCICRLVFANIDLTSSL